MAGDFNRVALNVRPVGWYRWGCGLAAEKKGFAVNGGRFLTIFRHIARSLQLETRLLVLLPFILETGGMNHYEPRIPFRTTNV